MADVTINQLTRGTPAGNNILPYSTGSNTLGVPVSALFQTVYSSVGIGTSSPQNKLDVNGASNFRGDLNILGTGAPAAGNYRLLEINSGNDAVRLRAGYGDTVFNGMGVSDVALGTLSNHDLKIYANNALHTTFKTNGDVIIPGKLINAGVAKAWANFNGKAAVGTNQPIRASYNITSILRTDDNLYQVTFPAGIFSNTDYAFFGTSSTSLNRASIVSGPLISAPTATTFKFGTFSLVYTGQPAGWINESAEYIYIAFFAL